MDNLLSKGDVVKTSLSDSTLVLKVEDNDALLFTGNQFVVAHGVQKENDHVFWNQGDYHDELPDNVFERGVQEEIPEQHPGEGKGFSYERFCEYVRSRLSIIYEGDQGEYLIMEDTDPLQEFGLMTEEETLKHIYDNNLFEQMEEIIRKSPAPYIYDSKVFESISETIKNSSSSELENEILIIEGSDNISVKGKTGTWYVIDSETIDGKNLFLLESEQNGDEAAALIVDEAAKLVLDDVYNGFDDYREQKDEDDWELEP